MADETFGARPVILRNDQPLAPALEPAVSLVQVESDLLAPDSCRIHILDPSRTALTDSKFEFLDKLTIQAAPPGERSVEPLFEGKVYSLGFDFDEAGAVLTIGAFDNSYALFNGLHTKTFRDLTDADLVRQIVQEVGLEVGDIQATDVAHAHIAQVNETHWDFLTRRAHEVDFELLVVGKKVHFRKSRKAADAPAPGGFDAVDRLQLAPGGNLQRFSARLTAAQQVSEVEVRGWDVHTKQAVVATAPATSRATAVSDAPADVAKRNGSARMVTTDLPLATQAECDAAAASEAERAASTFAHAEGVAKGDPRLLAGAPVSIGQTGGRFDGKYTVTSALHDFGHAGYRTRFAVTGGHDRSMLGLLGPSGAANGASSRVAGVVIGVVTNVSDPQQLGRVKVKLPWLSDDYESDWARGVFAGAAGDRGLMILPEVNDEVLLAFEQGDVRRPFVLGGLFNGIDKPPYADAVDASAGKVNQRGFKTRKGHELVFDDSDGKERIEIHTADGKVKILLDQAAGGLTIETDKDVEVKAGGNATVTASQNLTLEASRNATVKAGATLTLEGGTDVVVKGGIIRLN